MVRLRDFLNFSQKLIRLESYSLNILIKKKLVVVHD